MTGQDGAYFSELALGKGYTVHGVKRRSPSSNSGRVEHLYRLYASNRILINQESPICGETFVMRKITRTVAAVHLGQQDCLCIGNPDAERDWGHARDYVEGMSRILQQDTPDDYVLATGEMHTVREFVVREFVERAFAHVGRRIVWHGEGMDEQGIDERSGKAMVRTDPTYFRPTGVYLLLGDLLKAKGWLGSSHKPRFRELVCDMVEANMTLSGGGS
ncbi:GDP-mannose 4,6-dehydratase [Azospirillum sp. SYSU D00513]|uniref:GDP-mannose 4,6-dehydratase n=1 Tax=Azospirillum sp. SYSU D00513 TaxID=2812561 RepID=UPI0032B5321F